jgi:hypothetical protein
MRRTGADQVTHQLSPPGVGGCFRCALLACRLGNIPGSRRSHHLKKDKFFPQKPVGRSESVITLDDDVILGQLTPECARLAAAYEVDIENYLGAAASGAIGGVLINTAGSGLLTIVGACFGLLALVLFYIACRYAPYDATVEEAAR